MEIEKLLKNLIQNEKRREKRYILFMLLKFTGNVKLVEEDFREESLEQVRFPLLLLQNERFVLVYKEEGEGELEYLFTDYEEILVVLQKAFFENKRVFLQYEMPQKHLTKEEILEKIDEALERGDEESFKFYASKIE